MSLDNLTNGIPTEFLAGLALQSVLVKCLGDAREIHSFVIMEFKNPFEGGMGFGIWHQLPQAVICESKWWASNLSRLRQFLQRGASSLGNKAAAQADLRVRHCEISFFDILRQ